MIQTIATITMSHEAAKAGAEVSVTTDDDGVCLLAHDADGMHFLTVDEARALAFALLEAAA